MTKFNNSIFEPIAIIGVGHRLPSGSDLNSLWSSIEQNKCFIKPMSDPHSLLSQVYDPDPKAWNKTHSCLISSIDDFKFPFENFKNIPPSVIHSMDDGAKMAFVAGIESVQSLQKPLSSKNVFVSVAHSGFDSPVSFEHSKSSLYDRLYELKKTKAFNSLSVSEQKDLITQIENEYFKINEPLSTEVILHSASSAVAARISKYFGFTGGHSAVDSACASSFAAFDLALQKLKFKTVDAAVVGAIGKLTPFLYVYCSKAQTMSALGSFPFDQSASGFVAGEGVGFFVLKRLSDALQNKDHILGVIRGLAGSSDGSETGPWAPSRKGQKLALQRAQQQSGLKISDFQYVECHGTGTQVGDIEELSGLLELIELEKNNLQNRNSERETDFSDDHDLKTQSSSVQTPLYVGSAKASFGHLLTGAGMVGLLRTLSALQNKKIPTTVNVKNPITFFSANKSQVQLPQTLLNWEPSSPDKPRRALINCFGFGGVNYNMQLEEWHPEYHQKLVQNLNLQKIESKEKVLIAGLGFNLFGGESNISDLESLHQFLLKSPPDLKKIKNKMQDLKKNRWVLESKNSLHFSVSQKKKSYRWSAPHNEAFFIQDLDHKVQMRWKIPPLTIPHIDPNQFRLLKCVDQALKDSGLLQHKEILKDTLLLNGLMTESDFYLQEKVSVDIHYFIHYIKQSLKLPLDLKESLINEYLENMKSHLHTFNKDNSISGVDSMLGARVAKYFNLQGGCFSVDALCSSGLVMMDHAVKCLLSNEVKAVVVCASSRALSGPILSMYHQMGIISLSSELKPFALDAEGTLLGEGCVAFVLIKEDVQKQYNLKSWAYIQSSEIASDGFSPQMLAPKIQSLKNSISRALMDNKFQRLHQNPVLIEAQGLGVKTSDQLELMAFGEEYKNFESVYISSNKAYFGQLRVVSFLVSVLKQISSLHYKTYYGLKNKKLSLERNQSRLKFESTQSFEVLNLKSDEIILSVNTFAVGGLSGHLILSKNREIAPAQSSLKKQTFLPYEDNTLKNLQNKLTSEFNSLMTFKEFELAQLKARMKKTFFVEPSLKNQEWGLLLTGQSSAYDQMYASAYSQSAIFKKYFDQVDQFMLINNKQKVSDLLFNPKSDKTEIQSLWYSQFLSFLVQIASYEFLMTDERQKYSNLELKRPSILIGHSLGEISSLVIAEVISFEEGLCILKSRYEALASLEFKGSMVALKMTKEKADEIVQDFLKKGLNISVANINCQDQIVLSLKTQDLQKCEEMLTSYGLTFKTLNSSHAYHSELLKPAVEIFKEKIKNIQFKTPQIPITSFVFNSIVTPEMSILEMITEGLVKQVNYSTLYQLAVHENESLTRLKKQTKIQHFVDLGPGATSAKLFQKNHEVFNPNQVLNLIHTNSPKSDSYEELSKAQEELWTYLAQQQSDSNKMSIRLLQSYEYYQIIQNEIQDQKWNQFIENLKSFIPLSEFNTSLEKSKQNFLQFAPPHILKELKLISEIQDIDYNLLLNSHSVSSILTSQYGMCSGFAFNCDFSSDLDLNYQDQFKPHLSLFHGANYDLPFVTKENHQLFKRSTWLCDQSVSDLLSMTTHSQSFSLNSKQKVAQNSFYKFVGVFKEGSILPVSGVNEKGLCLTFAAAQASQEIGVGFSAPLFVRYALETCSTLYEVESLIKKFDFEGSWNFLVTSRQERKSKVFEVYQSQKSKREPSGPYISYANHFNSLLTYHKNIDNDSLLRQKRINDLLNDYFILKQKKQIEKNNLYTSMIQSSKTTSKNDANNFECVNERNPLDFAKSVLSDQFDLERNKRTAFPTKNTIQRFNTGISMIFDVEKNTLLTSTDHMPSSEGTYQVYNLENIFKTQMFSNLQKQNNYWVWKKKVTHTHSFNQNADIPLDLNIVVLYTSKVQTQNQICEFIKLKLLELPTNFKQRVHFYNIQQFQDGLNLFAFSRIVLIDLMGYAQTKSRTDENEAVQFLSTIQDLKQNYDFLNLEKISHSIMKSYKLISSDLYGESYLGFSKSLDLELQIKSCYIKFKNQSLNSFCLWLMQLLKYPIQDWGYENVWQNLKICELQWVKVQQSRQTQISPEFLNSSMSLNILITGGASGITFEILKGFEDELKSKNIKPYFYILGRTLLQDVNSAHETIENYSEYVRKEKMLSPVLSLLQIRNKYDKNQKNLKLKNNLNELEKRKTSFEYISLDLNHDEASLQLSQLIKNNNITIDILIHGAGLELSKNFKDKKLSDFNLVYNTKVKSTLKLLESLRGQNLKSLILFGSIASVQGNQGQTDYTAANQVFQFMAEHAQNIKNLYQLDKLSQVMTLAWPAWDEVGMATQSDVFEAMKRKGMAFLKVKEGVQFFIDQVLYQKKLNLQDTLDSQVVLCTCVQIDEVLKHPVYLQPHEQLLNMQDLNNTQLSTLLKAMIMNDYKLKLPSVFNEIYFLNPISFAAEMTLHADQLFLQDHIIQGQATVPGVFQLSCVIEMGEFLLTHYNINNEFINGQKLNLNIEKIEFHKTLSLNKHEIKKIIFMFNILENEIHFQIKNETQQIIFSSGRLKVEVNSENKINDNSTIVGSDDISYLNLNMIFFEEKDYAHRINFEGFKQRLSLLFPEKIGETYKAYFEKCVLKSDIMIHILTSEFLDLEKSYNVSEMKFNPSLLDMMNQAMALWPKAALQHTYIPFAFENVNWGGVISNSLKQILFEIIKRQDFIIDENKFILIMNQFTKTERFLKYQVLILDHQYNIFFKSHVTHINYLTSLNPEKELL